MRTVLRTTVTATARRENMSTMKGIFSIFFLCKVFSAMERLL